MRSKIALAGLAVGLLTALAPLAPASAQCDPDTGLGNGGCTNSCIEAGNRYEALRESVESRVGGVHLPSYWDLFACTM